jgi:D-alanyl-D-alanine carboxypeptidase (penicillin-binding protein 5/6)
MVGKKLPADPLDGQPFVTATAWGIADGNSGEFLWGAAVDKALPMASTTKVMTALVVLRVADQDPSILGESVVVSRFAANTGGSSARLQPGDRIVVGELLYGLLLPSGNDAANALAEHLGPRLRPPADPRSVPWTPQSSGRSKSWINFVAEMNRQAARLGMTRTHYANPHGLDARDHHSSVRDILCLAHQAMRRPEFRHCVGARRYPVKVVGGTGATRSIEWSNSNRLLGIEGYAGVKTGTTPRAGCCLVSCAERADDQLLLVVLNATNRGARYVDSRNLFRWAWGQRLAGGK